MVICEKPLATTVSRGRSATAEEGPAGDPCICCRHGRPGLSDPNFAALGQRYKNVMHPLAVKARAVRAVMRPYDPDRS
jgi:hypothetical protein